VEQTPGLLNYTSWVSINLEDRKNKLKTNKKGHIDGRQKTQKALQSKIPTNLKHENTSTRKTLVPTVPYQYSQKVNVLSPLSKKSHADKILLLEQKPAESSKSNRKHLTDLTPNYYGENRRMPVRVYQKGMWADTK